MRRIALALAFAATPAVAYEDPHMEEFCLIGANLLTSIQEARNAGLPEEGVRQMLDIFFAPLPESDRDDLALAIVLMDYSGEEPHKTGENFYIGCMGEGA